MNKIKFQLDNKTKLGKIAHFSTLPVVTCFQDCSYCYAKKAVRLYPAVAENYTKNTKALNGGQDLPKIPNSRSVVRMYVSGDFQNVHAVKAWIKLAKENKQKMFYGYTKQFKNEVLRIELEELKKLPNVILRASVDSSNDNVPKNWTKAGITDKHAKTGFDKTTSSYVCKFKENRIKCDKCKICFNPKLEHVNVYFPQH